MKQKGFAQIALKLAIKICWWILVVENMHRILQLIIFSAFNLSFLHFLQER